MFSVITKPAFTVFFLQVKIHLQTQAAEAIAVGYQHKHQGMFDVNTEEVFFFTHGFQDNL